MKKQIVALFVILTAASCGRNVDLLIVGGGTSGTAAGIQASRMGARTLIVEEGPWLGGMLTSAGVGCVDGNYTMRGGIFGEFADSLAAYYGGYDAMRTGWVSNLCFEPHVGAQIFAQIAEKEPLLSLSMNTRLVGASRCGKGWKAVFEGPRGRFGVRAKVLLDGTELGDVAATLGVPYSIGMDSRHDTGESIAPEKANNIVQDLTLVAILKDYGRDMTIPAPEVMITYGKLPTKGPAKYMINWPTMGNDFYTNLIERSPEERAAAIDSARNITLGFIHFMQTELGLSTLGIADDEFPTEDGLALIPYHRESRRTRGEVFFRLDDVARPFDNNLYRTAVAVGDYPVDHHHFRHPHWQELPYLEFYPVPSFSVPLGVMIPKGFDNLIVAEKSVSVSNLINGSTRLQPVVLGLGQAAGALAALSLRYGSVKDVPVRAVQAALIDAGAYVMPYADVPTGDPDFAAIQRIGATGILRGEGKSIGWSNRTFFHPDEPVVAEELFAEDYDMELPDPAGHTRRSYARLLDSLLNPFACDVNLQGRLVKSVDDGEKAL